MSALIFETIGGSRLYGFAKPDSDYDLFRVYNDNRPALHYQDGQADVVTIGLSTFMRYAQSGSHQSVEALYSRQKVYHAPEWAPFFESYIIRPGAGVRRKFVRTIKKFSFLDFKRRRHAVRLGFLLHGIESGKRPNPTLNPLEVSVANLMASQLEGQELFETLTGECPTRLGLNDSSLIIQ